MVYPAAVCAVASNTAPKKLVGLGQPGVTAGVWQASQRGSTVGIWVADLPRAAVPLWQFAQSLVVVLWSNLDPAKVKVLLWQLSHGWGVARLLFELCSVSEGALLTEL